MTRPRSVIRNSKFHGRTGGRSLRQALSFYAISGAWRGQSSICSLRLLPKLIKPHGSRVVASRSAGWQKPDGTVIHFISFVEQIAIVPKETTIYLVGEAWPALARFKRKWTKLATCTTSAFDNRRVCR